MSDFLAAAAGIMATAVAVLVGMAVLDAVLLMLGRALERQARTRPGAVPFGGSATGASSIGMTSRALPGADSAVVRRK